MFYATTPSSSTTTIVTTSLRTQKSSAGKCFTSVCYTADGACILAGGKSKYVCLYHAGERLMLRKWQLSHNRSMDGEEDQRQV